MGASATENRLLESSSPLQNVSRQEISCLRFIYRYNMGYKREKCGRTRRLEDASLRRENVSIEVDCRPYTVDHRPSTIGRTGEYIRGEQTSRRLLYEATLVLAGS